MAVNVGDIVAVFKVVDEASGELDKIAKEVKQTESSFGGLKTAITAVTVATTAVVAGMTAVATAIMKVGEQGSAVGDISEQFGLLAKKAGVDAAQALTGLREATAGTVSDFELMKATLPLLSSGFKGSAADLQVMASAARVLSERGMALQDAFQMVSSAMTTGRTRSLAMQGVVVDMKGALEDLTAATNEEGGAVETSAQLHVKQQKILEGLKGLVKENGAVMLDFADRTDQVRVRFTNLYNAFAKQVSESSALNSAIERVGQALINAFGGDQEAAIKRVVEWVERVGVTIANMAVAAIEWLGRMRPQIEAVAAIVQTAFVLAWDAATTAIGAVLRVFSELKGWFDALPGWTRNAVTGLAAFTAAVWLLNAALTALAGASVVGGIGKVVGSLRELFLLIQAFGAVEVFGAMGAGAAAAVGPIGAVAIALASVTAALYAGTIAWDLYKNAQQQEEDSANSVAAAWKQMDLASELVGYRVTSQADALIILREEAERQRASVTASTTASLNDAAAKVKQTEAIRLTAEQLKKLKEAEDAMSGAATLKAGEALVATYDRLAKQGIPATMAAQKELHKTVEEMVDLYLQAGKEIPPKLLTIKAATEDAARGMDRWSKENILVAQSLTKVWEIGKNVGNETMPMFVAFGRDMRETWEKVNDAIRETPELLDAVGSVGVPDMLKRPDMNEWGQDTAKSFADGFREIAKNFGSLMTDAIVNGNWKNAFTALGSQVGELLGKEIGKSIGASIGGWLGKAIGDILPGLGAMLGPLIGWIGDKVFKVEGRKVNDLRDQFVAASGGIDALNRSAQAAGLTLDEFLHADTVEEYDAAVKRLTEQFAKLDAAVEKYGLTWREMSGAQMTAGFDAVANGLLDNFNLLVGAGYDVDKVVGAMADDLNALLLDAMKFGQKLPAAMQPIIDKMVELGLISDEVAAALLGNAASVEAATAKATAAMQKQFDALQQEYDGLAKSIADEAPEEVMGVVEAQTRARMDAIQKEQDALAQSMEAAKAKAQSDAEALAEAIKDIFKDPIKVQIDWPTPPAGWPYLPGGKVSTPEAPEFAAGGWGDFGSGTLAYLHGREAIVPLDRPSVAGAALMNGGGGGEQTIIVPVNLDGQRITEVIMKRIGNRVTLAGVLRGTV